MHLLRVLMGVKNQHDLEDASNSLHVNQQGTIAGDIECDFETKIM